MGTPPLEGSSTWAKTTLSAAPLRPPETDARFIALRTISAEAPQGKAVTSAPRPLLFRTSSGSKERSPQR